MEGIAPYMLFGDDAVIGDPDIYDPSGLGNSTSILMLTTVSGRMV